MSDWGNDRSGQIMWTIVLFVIFGFGGCVYEYVAYSECRRVHPTWYCLGRQ